MADLSALQQKLKMLEQKRDAYKAGDKQSSYLPGDEQRQQETIGRTELFIRQVKREIAGIESGKIEQSAKMPEGADIHRDPETEGDADTLPL